MSERIVSLQDRLDVRATAMYRSGSTSYLDVLLGVSTFEDFATVWDTLNTLNAEDADLVASAKITKSTLESAQSELVEQQQRAAEQLSSAEAYMNQVLAKQDEYDRIYNNLSSEYRQILAEQEAAEAQASARAPQEFVPSPVEVTPPATSNSSGSGGSNGGGSSSSGGSSSITETPSGGGEAPSLPTNASVLDYAYSKARFSPGEAQPGDVLYKPGHVGISTGGISCVEAMGTRWGVVESCRGGWTAALRF